MPACDSASGRLGVTLTSSTSSSRPTAPAKSAPSAIAPRGSTMMPSLDSLMPSSASLHSMPGDITPRISRRSSVRPPGSVAPGGAHATRPPAAGTLGAPHTTSSSTAPSPARTRTRTICSFSAPGCGRTPRTSAICTPRTSRPRRSIDSTSRPASVRRSPTDAAVTPGGNSQSSRSQLKEIFMPARSSHRNCAKKRSSFS
jgi:hypothetical protein